MNVIVIVADSLRQDHLGCYGNSWIHTPHVDRLAAESLVCEHSYSENLPTGPTRTSWWTGRYGFTWREWTPLRTDDVLLPEVLWNHDVRSALVTDTYHMHKPGAGYGRGFDDVSYIRGQEYDPYVVDIDVDLAKSPWHWLPESGENLDGWVRHFEQYLRNRTRVHDEETTYVAQTIRGAMNWIDRQSARDQLFLWVDCFDPHEPWDPPEPYWSMYKDPGYAGRELVDPVPGRVGEVISDEELVRTRQLYAGEVSLVDAWVGKLLDYLRERGLYDDSLVIFTSDHGEPFGEHGIVRKARPWLHEELVRVPMIVHLPGGARAGERTDAFMHSPDMMPTILDAFGAPIPDGVQGKSWWPLLRGETDSPHDFAVIGARRPGQAAEWAIRDHRWSLLVPFLQHPGDVVRGTQLYDRDADPQEQRNVIAEHRDVADALELELYRFAQAVTPR